MGNIGVSMPSGHMDACQYRDFGCFCHNREFLRICAIVRATYEHVAIGDFVLFTIVKSILELMPVYGVFFLFSTIIGSILGSMPLFGQQKYSRYRECFCLPSLLGVFWKYKPLSSHILSLSKHLMIYLFCAIWWQRRVLKCKYFPWRGSVRLESRMFIMGGKYTVRGGYVS